MLDFNVAILGFVCDFFNNVFVSGIFVFLILFCFKNLCSILEFYTYICGSISSCHDLNSLYDFMGMGEIVQWSLFSLLKLVKLKDNVPLMNFPLILGLWLHFFLICHAPHETAHSFQTQDCNVCWKKCPARLPFSWTLAWNSIQRNMTLIPFILAGIFLNGSTLCMHLTLYSTVQI